MGVRFAPSPTGNFHLGNFRTAWISHFWARALGQPWIVRFEDIDEPRVVSGAAEKQLAELRELGLEPDEILIQTHRRRRHWEVFLEAVRHDQVYPCFCSRKEVVQALHQSASAPHQEPPRYSGHCRGLAPRQWPRNIPHATLGWRFKHGPGTGAQDFLVARTRFPEGRLPADGEPAALRLATAGTEPSRTFVSAYNWACAIDDFDGSYRLLVRAWDLASVLPEQRAIQDWLNQRDASPVATLPGVFHCALITGNSGERLEKRTRGVTLPELFQAGHSAASIVRRFEASFRNGDPGACDPAAFAPGRVWGERARTLTLGQLGF